MITGTPIKNMICPKCGSRNIDEFRNAYWYFCRECGYNSVPSSNQEKAKQNFLHPDDGCDGDSCKI